MVLWQGIRGWWWWCAALAAIACTTYDDVLRGDPMAHSGASGSGEAGTKTQGGAASSGGASSASGTSPASGKSGSSGSASAGTAPAGEAGAGACSASDCCPDDPEKDQPGECGCGTPDADSDSDGALDCAEGCPEDPLKVLPGVCGCGLPDEETAELAACAALTAALVHRYDFEGGGKAVRDRVGTAHGTVEGLAEQSEVAGKGVLALPGNGPYVNLPNFLLSKLTNATIESWVAWDGGKAWQRIFDFGQSNAMPPEDQPLEGKDYLFLSTSTHDAGGGSCFGYSLTGPATETIIVGKLLPQGLVAHVAGVVDTSADKLYYYLNGAKVGETPFTAALSSINDVNVWLGRSQYVGDAPFAGTYHEFRIYDQALTAKELATSYRAGPDAAFLNPSAP